jgi:hypothetical protein
MNKHYYSLISMLALVSLLFLGIAVLRPSEAKATPPQQYPIMDKVANKIIMKYQQSSCQDLKQKKAQDAPPSAEEIKVVEYLHKDPQMRAAFINKIAAPVANKLFECGMIP